MQRTIKIKQHDSTDCGPACLVSISAYYRRYYSLAHMRYLAGTTQQGTNLLGLMQAANHVGFDTNGIKASMHNLDQLSKPAIAHLVLDNQSEHFVVVYKVLKTQVHIMDPAVGKLIKMQRSQFDQEWTGVLVLLKPRLSTEKNQQKISTLRRLWILLGAHKGAFLMALLASILYGLLGLSTSVYIQNVTDQVLITGQTSLLQSISLLMLFLVLIQFTVRLLKDFLLLKMGTHLDAKLILDFYKRLLILPQQFFDTMQTGELISRINDAVKIRQFINQTLLELIVNVVALVVSFVLMFYYSWKLALFTFGMFPVYLTIYLITNRLNKKTERTIMERSADFESQLVESLGAIKSIKLFGLEWYSEQKTKERFNKLIQVVLKSASNSIVSNASLMSTTQIFTISIFWIGSYLVLNDELSLGQLLFFYALIAYVTLPISSLISSNKQIHKAFIAADRLYSIMDLTMTEDRSFNRITLKTGDIRFKNVDFQYGSQGVLFNKINLKITHGSLTAVVGESGSGKSTLIALIQKLYPIQSGCISIAKVDINTISTERIRDHISVVPQQIDLFSGSVRENIAIGDRQPDMQRIRSICMDLGILDFITSLPQGFDTNMANNGARFSGGQKQRLAIARALYRPFEILILDEPTSSIDCLSEFFIRSQISKLLAHKKTIVVTTHRINTVRKADSIVFVNHEHKISQGTHQELYNHNQEYKAFCNAQQMSLNKHDTLSAESFK